MSERWYISIARSNATLRCAAQQHSILMFFYVFLCNKNKRNTTAGDGAAQRSIYSIGSRSAYVQSPSCSGARLGVSLLSPRWLSAHRAPPRAADELGVLFTFSLTPFPNAWQATKTRLRFYSLIIFLLK